MDYYKELDKLYEDICKDVDTKCDELIKEESPKKTSKFVNNVLEGVRTLLWSWGSDTPSEVIWGINEIVEAINVEYNTTLPILEKDGSNWYDDDERFILLVELENFLNNCRL